ncbi:MAG: NAD-dependent succinate-semialdehyde dehydrogenase [Anaerolineae bacterium]|nr:NAD-dependent succinate-semialdehyde dehydrogenase [Anaerolineae bacterium]MDW8173613.1 NAD-dependent succinate-semialdehyde dehydrogenase [Anaerolineae bacterium]
MSDFRFQQLIGGQWTDASDGGTWALLNPAHETLIQHVPFGGAEDARAAIDAAHKAFPAWSRQTPYERGDVLFRTADWILARAEALARITTEEAGKPYVEALAEWRSAANYFRWNAEEGKRVYGRTIPARVATRRILVQRQPIGVVATITAWNFPVYNVVRSWAAALAAGCTVVGRPSEYTPRSAMLIAQALHESGAPPGVVNLVNGDPAAVAQVMLDDPRCRKISFTGSTRVGKLLMDGASRTVTRLSLELGGNAPVLILPDVDVGQIAKDAVAWKFRNCGQVCVAPQRFFVHARIVEEFTERVAELTARLTVGDGQDTATHVGPLINARQRDRVEGLVSDAVQRGAQVIVGGQRPAHLERGYFYAPTVIGGVRPDMPLYHEETFGPVLPVLPFDDLQQAIAWANDTEYGLAAFVMTRDLNSAFVLSERLEYGMVCVNDWLPATPEAPFGGVKQSGIGRESGTEGLEDYLETKTVMFAGIS